MVSSDAETGMGDCCVGTIVWVRRRNGSWWPGKILGPDELSASHLMSPRSGTPVKLLGREDASVDWYNLEKSKRVKPFRCGEFDDCIERAEASQGMPPKKREKYARREDAILHALELEKQLLEKKHGKLGVSSNGLNTNLLAGVGKDTTEPPELSCDNPKYEASKMDTSLEDKRKGHSLQAQSFEDVDDKSSYVRPRVRGLQDIGTGPVLSKYKLSSLPNSNGSHKHAPDIGNHADLNGLTPENMLPSSCQNLSEKRKRSQDSHLEEGLGKKRDKHRPLVQVLERIAKSPAINSLQLQDDGSSAPPLIAGKEQREHVNPAKTVNDAGTTIKSNESFDYTETLPDQVENTTPLSESGDKTFPFGLSEENTTEDTETDSSGTESLISDTYDAMTTLSDEAEHIELIPKSFGPCETRGENESMSDDNGETLLSSVTFSKWQLKGKRKSRTNAGEKRVSTGSSHWFSFKGEDADRTIRGLESCHDFVNWEDLTQNDEPFAFERYWEQSADPVSIYGGGRMKSMLIDVEVQVQSGYQREHVPMISLMSKVYDKAIVGHPIPIETLESLSAADELPMESSCYDTMLQPWRTARRTANCRVPRVSTLDEEEEEQQHHEYAADEERKPSRKGAPSRKFPAAKLLKRPHRRSGLSSSQKTRMLSSIGGSEQQTSDLKAEGVMKPESLATAAVACIPVKLVFSRLHEELVARHQ